MAGTTPTYGLRYAELADPPDGAALGKNLADDVEAELDRIDTAHADLAAELAQPRILHLANAPATSVGTYGWGASAELTVTGRRVRLAVAGAFDPAGGDTGFACKFERSTDGGATWGPCGPIAGQIAATDYPTAFAHTFVDSPTEPTAYRVHVAAAFLNGAVMDTESQFTVTDEGPAA